MSDETQLHEVIWYFHDTLQRRDGIEDRLRQGESSRELDDRALRASEAVVNARLALFRMLVHQGWLPPAHIVRQLSLDTQLLQETSDPLTQVPPDL